MKGYLCGVEERGVKDRMTIDTKTLTSEEGLA